ncbi:hypothetical protein [Streptococcus pluranimalium]|uniref:hypothetical protein n=1 Tax=Streptococcus pluranimalium TaxID=82348 RepID=UPI003F677DCF
MKIQNNTTVYQWVLNNTHQGWEIKKNVLEAKETAKRFTVSGYQYFIGYNRTFSKDQLNAITKPNLYSNFVYTSLEDNDNIAYEKLINAEKQAKTREIETLNERITTKMDMLDKLMEFEEIIAENN